MTRAFRSGLVTGATLTQLVSGLLWLGVVLYLLWLIRAPQTRQVPDPEAAVWGLEIAAGIIAPLALLALAGAYGMGKNKRWGWWLALLADWPTVLALVYGMIDDGWSNIDSALVTVTAVCLAPAVLLLLPGVRRFYWEKPAARDLGATH